MSTYIPKKKWCTFFWGKMIPVYSTQSYYRFEEKQKEKASEPNVISYGALVYVVTRIEKGPFN